MEEKTYFQSEFVYDLPMHQEYTRLIRDTYEKHIVSTTFVILYLLYGIWNLQIASFRWIFPIFCCIIAIPRLLQNQREKKGDLSWKQVLHRNGGTPSAHRFTAEEPGLRNHNLSKNNEIFSTCDQVTNLHESKNLLLVMTDLKYVHIIDKRTLEGGSREELIAFLRQKCPKLKKRISTGRLSRILQVLMWTLMVVGLLRCLSFALELPQKFRGQISRNASYSQMAEELRPLGIDISQATIDAMEQFDLENRRSPLLDGPSRVLDLLCWEGQGTFEKHVFHSTAISEAFDIRWTPSTSGVYWFDTEVYDFGKIYTNFLTGISAMDSSIQFSNIVEDYSKVDIVGGQGQIKLSFDYLGTNYRLIAQYQDDWFDTEMLYELGKILNRDPDPKNLWYTTDGQGILLYYGTPEQCGALESKTGLMFLDPVENHLSS